MEIYFKLKEALGPWGAIGALAILVGLALSTGMTLDDLKNFPPTHFSIQAAGLAVGITGLLIIIARFKDVTDETATRRTFTGNWNELIRILKSHQALCENDTPIFPNRVVQSMYRLRNELNEYLKTIGTDSVSRKNGYIILKFVGTFITSIEQIEHKSNITLHSDADVKLCKLPLEHRHTLECAHDKLREAITTFIKGVYLGRGEPNFPYFYDRVPLE